MTDILAEIDRPDGIIPVTPESVGMLVEEIKRLRTVVEFYADRKNWQSPSSGFALQYDPEPSPVQTDWGEKARLSLLSIKDPPQCK